MAPSDDERERIVREFERRDHDRTVAARYEEADPANAFMLQQRKLAFRRALARAGVSSLARARVLDVGCGHGGEIERLAQDGADPQRIYGIDLTFARVLSGTRAGIPHLVCADGAHIPFRDAAFDLALMNTVMTSVLSEEVRRAIAVDVLRILRPGGLIAWYDFIWNPRNRETRGIGRGELSRLFPGCRIRSERVTLAPPIARAIVPRWPAGAVALDRVPLLRSHLIGTIRKPA